MVREYKPGKPIEKIIKMKLTLENEIEVYQRPRRLAPKEREIVNEQ